ncbi:MAG TPA: hypothetical protein VKW06_03630 [Candidatus Angelobacter sp.]|nr:hypothetical protein [Candidatus Angelobacter sp.]
MDDQKPKTYDESVKQGHDVSDISIGGVVMSLGGLALAGFFALVLMRFLLSGLQWFEQKTYPVQLTDSQKKMKMERAGPENLARLKSEGEGEVGRIPESYSREDMEKHLAHTFPVPRLQYDDIAEMDLFRSSEESWLASTGKDSAGNIHIPVDHAIDLVAQQGLPQVSGPFVPPTLPSAVPLVPAPSRK